MTLTHALALSDEVRAPRTGWSRVLDAARVQYLSRAVLVWPWAVLASAFVINLVVFAFIDTDDPTTGGLASLYVVALIVAMQTVSQFLPLSLGLGVTRRAFYAAATLGALGQTLVYGIGLTVLLAIEDATDGWGLTLHFFGVDFLVTGDPLSKVLVYAAPFLLVSAAGLLWGAVAKRWGSAGIFLGLIASALLVGGLVVLLGRLDAWSDVGDFFGDSPALVAIGLPSLVAGALLCGAGYLVVRRTPA